MIDLRKLSADDRTTFKVYVSGGPDDPNAAGFEVVGPDSAEFHKVQSKIAAQAMRDAKSANFPNVDTDEGVEEVQLQTENRLRLIALSCTVGIFGFTDGGQPVAFTKASVEQLLTLRPRWALRITRAVEIEANFTKG